MSSTTRGRWGNLLLCSCFLLVVEDGRINLQGVGFLGAKLCCACRPEKLASTSLDARISVGVHVWTLTPDKRPGVDAKKFCISCQHFNGKSLDNAIPSIPAGVDSSDWQTMCEKWTNVDEREIFYKETMTQLMAPSSDADAESHTPATPEEAFISVMGKD
ncbi:hypothetical protein Taro_054648 [Colocasia esculenta]|uniref:Uncharacterized protein n=1 Tax=Colocasia esculenta TaxID=4460 RepID=A0A843XRT9_COLES|nr:hypothetical protein [Colocasia esculenta]